VSQIKHRIPPDKRRYRKLAQSEKQARNNERAPDGAFFYFAFISKGRNMIQIRTTHVPAELRDHPDFKRVAQYHEHWFNSHKFDRKQRTIISLHEGTHLVYAREIGFDPEPHGPSVDYDFDTETFRRLDSSVEGLPYEIKMSADPILVAKFYMAPVYVEEKLLSHRTREEIWEDARGDLKNYNNWFVQRHNLKGDVYPALVPFDLREAVYKDCRSPAFRKKLWDAAREFETRVFGMSEPKPAIDG
jgi:hypothetical protein